MLTQIPKVEAVEGTVNQSNYSYFSKHLEALTDLRGKQGVKHPFISIVTKRDIIVVRSDGSRRSQLFVVLINSKNGLDYNKKLVNAIIWEFQIKFLLFCISQFCADLSLLKSLYGRLVVN